MTMLARKTFILGILGALMCAGAATAARIEVVAGAGDKPAGGSAVETKLIEPFAVAFDSADNWYICEFKGQRIDKVSPGGILTVFGGRREPGFGGDGGPAHDALFTDPHGIVISPDQQMYVADTWNNRIRRIDLRTGRIETIAGTGEKGFSGDGGPAREAAFNGTFAVALDAAGDQLFVADLGNKRIRRINLRSGIVTTVAGDGAEGVPSDGAVAAESPLLDPRAVAVDSEGKLYILERRGNALRVVDRAGKIRTLIAPGDLTPDLKGPKHLAVNHHDDVIIADAENHLIRKYSPSNGRTVVIAGTGERGNRLVEHDPLQTQLARPHGVSVHSSGALYISDSYNARILKMTDW